VLRVGAGIVLGLAIGGVAILLLQQTTTIGPASDITAPGPAATRGGALPGTAQPSGAAQAAPSMEARPTPTTTASVAPAGFEPVFTAVPSGTGSRPPSTGSGAASATTGKPVESAAAPPGDDSGPFQVRIMKALEAGQSGKAVQLAQQYTAQAPGNALAWHLRGAAEQAAGRGGRASFRKCAELSPADSPLGAECKALAGD
jgi:hypothetical protein